MTRNKLGKELTLRISSRPLRMVFVVEDREDLIRAIRLFTHLWGGEQNVILPAPSSPDEVAQFDFALRCSDPDVILFSRELSSYATNVVNLFPSSQRLLTDHEIERHNEGVEWIQLKELGTIPHISFLLYRELQEPLRQNRIRICDSAGPYAFYYSAKLAY